MEFVAWFTHKYVMHGFLWYFHKDHHTRDNKGVFEKNDFFFLIFAIPGSFFMMYGIHIGIVYFPFWIGLGITVYGAAYFFVHDLLSFVMCQECVELMTLLRQHSIIVVLHKFLILVS